MTNESTFCDIALERQKSDLCKKLWFRNRFNNGEIRARIFPSKKPFKCNYVTSSVEGTGRSWAAKRVRTTTTFSLLTLYRLGYPHVHDKMHDLQAKDEFLISTTTNFFPGPLFTSFLFVSLERKKISKGQITFKIQSQAKKWNSNSFSQLPQLLSIALNGRYIPCFHWHEQLFYVEK